MLAIAAFIGAGGYGQRIAVKPMTPVRQARLHNRHAFGLVVRLITLLTLE